MGSGDSAPEEAEVTPGAEIEGHVVASVIPPDVEGDEQPVYEDVNASTEDPNLSENQVIAWVQKFEQRIRAILALVPAGVKAELEAELKKLEADVEAGL
jgi:hypothetical protein